MNNPSASPSVAPREELPAIVRLPYGSASMVARNWVVDLRRKCFIEMGGTSRPRDIWNSISRRIETGEITACGFPIVLRPDQERAVRRAARHVVANCVAEDFRAVI
jgi:hypothetical protein